MTGVLLIRSMPVSVTRQPANPFLFRPDVPTRRPVGYFWPREEPYAGKPHVRSCAGDRGNLVPYRYLSAAQASIAFAVASAVRLQIRFARGDGSAGHPRNVRFSLLPHMGCFRSSAPCGSSAHDLSERHPLRSAVACAGRWRVTRKAGRSAAEQGAKRP